MTKTTQDQQPDPTTQARPSQDAAPSPQPAQANGHKGDPAESRIIGVFSRVVTQAIGTGTTRKKVSQEFFYYAEEEDDGAIAVKPLNQNHVPSGNPTRINKEELLKQYTPRPDVYLTKVIPAIRELQKTVARADRLRQQGQPYTAEFEYANALKMDDSCCRAVFGLGLVYMDRGDKDKADGIFKKLIELEETFQSENKHLFNEFGIGLRKNKMADEALHYYMRAYKVTKNDENLLYNMARAFMEKGDLKMAAGAIQRALKLNPDFEEAKKFLAYLTKQLAKEAAQS